MKKKVTLLLLANYASKKQYVPETLNTQANIVRVNK